ncbi:sarcosine oxidase subunit gamma [Sulfitobacter sp. 1A15299]|uniref:sarcosine oxidase subunit gamma n=1 Tax=Sulfitobacter sp. 1A15299 TaxID=3368598 RepID=UPI003744FC46
MVELKAQTPFGGLLPLHIGDMTVAARDLGQLTVLGVFDRAGLTKALEAAHGVTLPEPLQSIAKGDAQCLWFGREEALLVGPAPDEALAKHAALVDVSDGWAVAELQGPGAEDVLARLAPVDLRAAAFKPGQTLRSPLRDMPAAITRTDTGFLLMVYRSMAATLVQELRRAMEAVASRR